MKKQVGYWKFRAGSDHFLYDTHTNAILPISPEVFAIVDEYAAGIGVRGTSGSPLHKRAAPSAVAYLHAARRRDGILRPLIHRSFGATLTSAAVRSLIDSTLHELILDVTESCNQRCAYCVREPDRSQAENAGAGLMSWDVARASIDYFMARSEQCPIRPTVIFYGGEPLLAWPLVARCVRYIRTKSAGSKKPFTLCVVTNGTLIDRRRLSFLLENDVRLQISLDGPREIHDHGRVFLDGRGTHDRVLRNLRRIRDEHPEYYRNQLLVRCVLHPACDVESIFEYFCQPEFRGLMIAVSPMVSTDRRPLPVSRRTKRRQQEAYSQLIERYLSSFAEEPGFNYDFFWSLFGGVRRLLDRPIGRVSGDASLNGSCVPGVRRIFVTPDGKFHVCEKFKVPSRTIGDAHRGIDLDSVMGLICALRSLCNRLCQDCWAHRLCTQCGIHAAKQGTLSEEAKQESCKATREQIETDLTFFVRIWRGESAAARKNQNSLHYYHRFLEARRATGRE